MPVIHNQPPGELFVKIGHAGRMVDPASLTAQQKRLVWAGLKRSDPALAQMLKNDRNLKELKTKFNASLRFPADDFNRYLQTGLKLLEEKKPC